MREQKLEVKMKHTCLLSHVNYKDQQLNFFFKIKYIRVKYRASDLRILTQLSLTRILLK